MKEKINHSGKIIEGARLPEKLLRKIIADYPNGFFFLDRQCRFLELGKPAEKIFGRSASELRGSALGDVSPDSLFTVFYENCQKALRENVSVRFEIYSPLVSRRFEVEVYPYPEGLAVYLHDTSGDKEIGKTVQQSHDELELRVTQRTMELFEANIQLQQEILERREIQKHIHLSNELFKLLGRVLSRQEYIEQVVKLLHKYVGCRCIGLRLVNETGNIPYETYAGFSREFWEAENWLSVKKDRCACIRVINGQRLPLDSVLWTAQGSFYCQDSLKFFAGLSPEEKSEFRSVCVEHGFASIVVIPIRHKKEVIGVIHLADEKEGQIPNKIVGQIESLAYSIGEGIRKFDLEDRIRQDYDIQKIINELLQLSITNIDVAELCQTALERLLTISWFDFYPRGTIHLLEENSGFLVLKAHLGLTPAVREKYGRVPVSGYMGGQSVLEEKIQIFDYLNKEQRADKSLFPSKHFRLPILLDNQILGVITASVKDTYAGSLRKEESLKSVADVLAGVIQHKRLEYKLAETNELLLPLFSSSNYLIAYMDTNFNFVRVNEAYAYADEHTPDYYIGKNHFTLFPDAENEAIFQKVIATGQSYSVYAKAFAYQDHPERGISYWDWNLQPVKDPAGNIEGILLTLVNVTKRKQAEEELLKTQKELSETKRLSDIGMLAATVAHELRNPLAVIRLAAYSLRKKAANPLLEQHLNNIEKKIMESDQIINNLLFYSRLKHPDYKKVSIYEILQECVNMATEKFCEYQVIVKRSYESIKDIFIEADPLQMKEVFNNMLDNAYESLAAKKGFIEVSAGYELSKKEIAVIFKDSGIGISPADLKKIAGPFFTRKTKGTGLGLTVSYQIIELHRGKISVESDEGAGTTFVITLPVGRQTPREKKIGE